MSEGASAKDKAFETAVSIDEALCRGCASCVNACPVDVLAMDARTGKAHIAFPQDCCVCFLCQDDCPSGAITVDHNRKSNRLFSIYDQLGIQLPDWVD